jgi:hypothetical protein
VLTPPWQDGGAFFASPDAKVFPITEALAIDDWHGMASSFVIITGLEEGLRSRELATRTLAMLEALLAISNKTIILMSAVDPFSCLMDHDGGQTGLSDVSSTREWLRWLSVLNAFARESLYTSALHRLTMRDCHLLWRCCSAREKLVLWQLVKFRLPNPKNNSALDSLIQRGLVSCGDTRFCIISDDFANFVRSDGPRREVQALFPPDSDSAWRGVRWVFIYMAIMAVAVVSFTLVDSWEWQPVMQILAVGGAVGGAAFPVLKTAFEILPGAGKKRTSSA